VSEPPSPREETNLPSLGPRGEGWFVLQIVFMGIVLVAGLLAGANWSGAPRFAAGVAGAVLMLGGVLLAYRGVRDLDRSLSPMPRPTDDAVLISDGIYRRLRHPIYAGLLLLAIGWSLLTASLLAIGLSAAFAVLLDLKARREEIWLRERFAGYAAYASRTSRFVPGLY
jgi:protein-S-isoprenylcysteine O-methyltransferase Ste14